MNLLNWYTNTSWHQWWMNNVWKPSWTKFTTWLYGLPAALLTLGQTVSHFANDTTIASYMDKIGMPNWVPASLAGIALIYYIATSHSED